MTKQGSPHVNDWIWLSGFFDGEGTIMISCRKNKSTGNILHHICLALCNTHKPAIDRIKAITQCGATYLEKRTRITPRPLWYWRATTADAARVISLMYPYLVIKKQQAKLALDFRKSKERCNGQRGIPAGEFAYRQAIREAISQNNQGIHVDVDVRDYLDRFQGKLDFPQYDNEQYLLHI